MIDENYHPINTLIRWTREARIAIKVANQRHIGTLRFSPIEIRMGMEPAEYSSLATLQSIRKEELRKALSSTAAQVFTVSPEQQFFNVLSHLTIGKGIQQSVRASATRITSLQHERINRNLGPSKPHQVSDMVILNNRHIREESKQPVWTGPFRIQSHVTDQEGTQSEHSFILQTTHSTSNAEAIAGAWIHIKSTWRKEEVLHKEEGPRLAVELLLHTTSLAMRTKTEHQHHPTDLHRHERADCTYSSSTFVFASTECTTTGASTTGASTTEPREGIWFPTLLPWPARSDEADLRQELSPSTLSLIQPCNTHEVFKVLVVGVE